MKEGKCAFRHGYSGRFRVQVDCSATEGSPGAVQSFKKECDINQIMAKYQRTGMIEWLSRRDPEYLDCTGEAFQEAMFTVIKAREMFAELPSSMRDRFKNDPGELLRFLGDEANRQEAIELGLVAKPDAPLAPVKVEVVAPAPA